MHSTDASAPARSFRAVVIDAENAIGRRSSETIRTVFRTLRVMDAESGHQASPPDGSESDLLEGFVEAPIPEDAWKALIEVLNPLGLRASSVHVRTHALGCDVLMDARWHEPSSGRSNRSMRRMLMLLYRPGVLFPSFEILSRAGIGGRLAGAVAGMAGMPTMAIAGHPEFARRYMLLTANSNSVRVLLEHVDMHTLLESDDMHVKADGSAVVVMRSGKPTPENMARLALEASLICVGFTDDPDVCERAEAAAGGSYLNEAVRTLSRSGTGMGRMVRALSVSQAAVTKLREASPPRISVAPSIMRRACRDNAWVLLAAAIFGCGFLPAGIVFALAGATGSTDRMIGLLFALLGVLAWVGFALALRYRLARRRLVREGRVVAAVLEELERTNVEINGDRLHRAVFRFVEREEGMPERARLRLRPTELEHARRALRDGRETWVLQDPKRPDRILWPPSWVLETEAPESS